MTRLIAIQNGTTETQKYVLITEHSPKINKPVLTISQLYDKAGDSYRISNRTVLRKAGTVQYVLSSYSQIGLRGLTWLRFTLCWKRLHCFYDRSWRIENLRNKCSYFLTCNVWIAGENRIGNMSFCIWVWRSLDFHSNISALPRNKRLSYHERMRAEYGYHIP